MGSGILVRCVIQTQDVRGLRYLFETVYRWVLKRVERRLVNDGTSLYIRGGFTRSDWVPVISDIDLYLVLRDKQSAGYSAKLFSEVRRVSRFSPASVDLFQ